MYKKVKNSIKLCDKSDNLSIKVCFYCAFSSWFQLKVRRSFFFFFGRGAENSIYSRVVG